jgi:hypothetical protein
VVFRGIRSGIFAVVRGGGRNLQRKPSTQQDRHVPKMAIEIPNKYLTISPSSESRLLGLEAQDERKVVGRLDPSGRSPVTDRLSLGSSQPNLVPIRLLPAMLDPVFHDAHELIDRVPRRRLLGLIPLLRRAAEGAPTRAGRAERVGEKNLPSATRTEPPTPGIVGAAGPG